MLETVKIFGEARALINNHWVEFPNDNRGALLVYLAYHSNWIKREQLSFLFWPDKTDIVARRNLRQLINRIKPLPFYDYLELDRHNIRWQVRSDIMAFEEAIEQMNWQLAYTGFQDDFSISYQVKETVAIKEWLDTLSLSLAEKKHQVALNYVNVLVEKQDYHAVSDVLEPLLEDDGILEDVLQLYLRNAQYTQKRQKALGYYKLFCTELRENFGLEPLPETQTLAENLGLQQPLQEPVQLPHSLEAASEATTLGTLLDNKQKLVGREDLLQNLVRHSAKTIIIKGEAGIGKSSLIKAFVPHAHMIKCEEGLNSIPYYSIRRFIRSHQISETLKENLGARYDDLLRLVPELDATQKAKATDPLHAKNHLLNALTLYFKVICSDSYLVFEDLQWADEQTLECIAFLNNHNIKLILSYRSYEINQNVISMVNGLSNLVEHVEVQAITKEDTLELLKLNNKCSIVGEYSTQELQQLYDYTGGNPLFILETLKVFDKTIDVNLNPQKKFPKPSSTVKRLIDNRIASLSGSSRRVLELASILVSDFTVQQLSNLAALSISATIDALEELDNQHLIKELKFCHDLSREVAYQGINPQKRQLLHEHVANMLVENEKDPTIIAEHYLQAADEPKAWYNLQKITHQLRIMGYQFSAVHILENAVQRFETSEIQTKLRILRIRHLAELSNNDLAEHELELLLEHPLSNRLKSAALLNKCVILNHYGRLKESEKVLDWAMEYRDKELEAELGFNSNSELIFTKGIQGNIAEIWDIWEEELARIEAMDQEKVSNDDVVILSLRGAFHDRVLQPHEAQKYHRRATTLAKRNASPSSLFLTAVNQLTGALSLDEAAIHEAVEIAEDVHQLGTFDMTPYLVESIVAAYIQLGDYDKAASFLMDIPEESIIRTALLARQAQLYFAKGETDQALDYLQLATESLEHNEYLPGTALVILLTAQHGKECEVAKLEPMLERIEKDGIVVHPSILVPMWQAINNRKELV